MSADPIALALPKIFDELIRGSPDPTARTFVLNQGDRGLLESLERLSAAAASATHGGGASIAAHVDHLRYGLSLLNRWADGVSPPWPEMDWTASWRRTVVSETEWRNLRDELRREAARWAEALGTNRDVSEVEAGWMAGSVAHLAYHLGAIRQIDRATRGPTAEDELEHGSGGGRSVTVVDWLLDSDPSIRWQAMRDLTDAPADEVAAERARVAREGTGAQLLALQAADGRWGGAAWNRGWNSTMHVLWLLRHLGLDPASTEARRAVGLVRDQVTWQGCGPPECDGNPFFAGEAEPCINGQVAAAGAYFGQDVRGIVDRLLREQLPDGGWNCEAPDRSTRSSFNTTICVLEALLEHERAGGGTPEVIAARLRGQEYLLERRLFRRLSTGEVIQRDRKGDASWARFAFPTWWHYDVLRGLEYLRRAGVTPDKRVAEAIELVASKRDDQGRWPLETRYPGVMPVEIDEGEGRPSRWNTLRALRVLRWYERADSRERL